MFNHKSKLLKIYTEVYIQITLKQSPAGRTLKNLTPFQTFTPSCYLRCEKAFNGCPNLKYSRQKLGFRYIKCGLGKMIVQSALSKSFWTLVLTPSFLFNLPLHTNDYKIDSMSWTWISDEISACASMVKEYRCF